MKSRTVQTCENILKTLIKKYGPSARVGWPIVDIAVMEHAGGDNRTLKRFREQLVLLDFLRNHGDTVTFNFVKVDYRQVMLQDALVMGDDEPP